MRRAVAVALAVAGLFHGTASTADELRVAGWVEEAMLVEAALVLSAKLDSGAEHSSLHTEKIRLFRRKGERWVRFSIEDDEGESTTFERPLLRQAAIRRHFGERHERPVIELELCLGGVRKEVEVNLVDRSGFDYPMLLGRSFLAGDFLIDTRQTGLLEAKCVRDRED